MSQQSIIYGYIQGAEWMSSDPGKLHRLNCEVIGSLPENDSFPYLSRRMFSYPGEKPAEGTYRSQVIHFGASIHALEPQWRKWLEKFEALLRKLYWFHAEVHLRSESTGDFDYQWAVDANQIVHFFNNPPLAATKWIFDGGPRDLDI